MSDQHREIDIVLRAAAGDRLAQSWLHKKFSPDMMPICFRIVGNYEDAEEVLSDALRKWLENLKFFEYRNERKFRNWTKKIVLNESYMYKRKNKNRIPHEELHPEFEVNINSSVLDELAEKDIMTSVYQLPGIQSKIFNYHFVLGYTIKEIGKMLDTPLNTIKWHLIRSKNNLKEKLAYYKINNKKNGKGK